MAKTSSKSLGPEFIALSKDGGQKSQLGDRMFFREHEFEAQVHRVPIKDGTRRPRPIRETDYANALRFYESRYGETARMERYMTFTRLDPENSRSKFRLVIPSEDFAVLADIMDNRPFTIKQYPGIRFERKIMLGVEEPIEEIDIDVAKLRLAREEYPDLSRPEGMESLRIFTGEITRSTKTSSVFFKVVNRRVYDVAPGVSVMVSQEQKSDRSLDSASMPVSIVSARNAPPVYSIEVEITEFDKLEDKSVENVYDIMQKEVYRAVALLQGDQVFRPPRFFKDDLVFLNGTGYKTAFAAVKSLDRRNLLKIKSGHKDIAYAVSPKADGVTAAVIINPHGTVYIYDIVAENLIVSNATVPEKLGATILEGEYIAEQNMVYVYDVIMHNVRDVRDELYFDRLRIVDEIIASAKFTHEPAESSFARDFRFVKKDIYVPYDIDVSVADQNADTLRQVRRMMTATTYPYEIDGVVLTGNTKYPRSKNAMRTLNAENIFKYKPLKAVTVDFLIRYTRDRAGIQVIENIEGQDYCRIVFFVYKMTKDRARAEAISVHDDLFPVNERGYFVGPNGNEVKDDCIVEARYIPEERSWEIVRVRFDKTDRYRLSGLQRRTANSLMGYTSTLEVTEDPISFDELELSSAYYEAQQTKIGFFIRKVHNAIKFALIQTCIGTVIDSVGEITDKSTTEIRRPHIIDFSIGQGGDLTKYEGAEYVFCMDIDAGNLTIAKANAVDRNVKNAVFARGDATKSLKMLDIFGDDAEQRKAGLAAYANDSNFKLKRAPAAQYDIAVLNFTLTHLFGSSKDLETFIKNVEHALRPGGLLIITTIDGNEVLKLFEENDSDTVNSDTGLWSFKDINDLRSKKRRQKFGQKYQYLVRSISDEYYEEYMTDIGEFLARAKKHGLVPATNVLDTPVASFDSMDPSLIDDLPKMYQEFALNAEHHDGKTTDERYFAMHKYIVLRKT